MKPRLWIFNYDFELNLAKRSPQLAKQGNRWYVLNRSVSWLAPLLRPNDLIYAVAPIPEEVSSSLTVLLGFQPQFLVAPPEIETNDMALNLQNSGVDHSCYELAYWGATSKKAALLNSKQTSLDLREEHLPSAMMIPACWLPYLKNFGEILQKNRESFAKAEGAFFIKDPLGFAGANLWENRDFSEKELKQLVGMARQSGGLLLEKKIDVKREWSLHFDFGSTDFRYIGVTELFSNASGSYLGSKVSSLQNFPAPIESFTPFLEAYLKLGAFGPLGLDLLEGKDGKLYLIEVNCRYTMGRLALEWSKKLQGEELKIENCQGEPFRHAEGKQAQGQWIRFIKEEGQFWGTILQQK